MVSTPIKPPGASHTLAPGLLVGGVGGVVGGQHVDLAALDPPPQGGDVGGRPDGRVELDQVAEAGIGGVVQQQVADEHLAGDVLAPQAGGVDEVEPGGGREMVDVQAGAGAAGEGELCGRWPLPPRTTAGTPGGRWGRCGPGARSSAASRRSTLSFSACAPTTRPCRGARLRPVKMAASSGQALSPVVWPMNSFSPSAPRRAMLGDLAGVGLAEHAVEAEVDVGLGGHSGQLGGEDLGGGHRRDGVGHVDHGRHPAGGGGPGAREEVFFFGHPRLAQVDVGIDQAGHDHQPGGVHFLGGGAQPRWPTSTTRPSRTARSSCADESWDTTSPCRTTRSNGISASARGDPTGSWSDLTSQYSRKP